MLPAVVTEDDQCSTEEALADVVAEADLVAKINGLVARADAHRAEILNIEKGRGRRRHDLGEKRAETSLADVANESVLETGRDAVNAERWFLLEILAEASDGRYEAADVLRWVSRSMAKGVRFPTVARSLIEDMARYRKVPNEPLREAAVDHLEESGRTWYELADSAGFKGSTPQHATTLLRYSLGLAVKPPHTPGNAPSCPYLMPYEDAVRLALTIGITPQQAGV